MCSGTSFSIDSEKRTWLCLSQVPSKALRFSLEISPKLPAEITKCLEDTKQWLQVWDHSLCLCVVCKEWWNLFSWWWKQKDPSVDDLLQWDKIEADVGSFKALPKKKKSSQKKDFFFLKYWNNYPGITLGELPIQTSPSSFLPSIFTLPLPLSLERACWDWVFFCYDFACISRTDVFSWFSVFFFTSRQPLIIKLPMKLLLSWYGYISKEAFWIGHT